MRCILFSYRYECGHLIGVSSGEWRPAATLSVHSTRWQTERPHVEAKFNKGSFFLYPLFNFFSRFVYHGVVCSEL